MRGIKESDYGKILELDSRVYPTDWPVTGDVLASWYQRNPEFGMMYEDGVCIAIPLNRQGWEQLIGGVVEEYELGGSAVFDGQRDQELGIHVYHLEKFGRGKGFYREVLADLGKLVGNLRTENSNLRVIGFSGLCVTSAGCGLFANKLNCREREYVSSEHVLKKDGKIVLVETESQRDLADKLKEGFAYSTRCKMLSTMPGEVSVVWEYLE